MTTNFGQIIPKILFYWFDMSWMMLTNCFITDILFVLGCDKLNLLVVDCLHLTCLKTHQFLQCGLISWIVE